ncbi:hypothetical protein F5Y13DRAFT_191853 [Hypoxylon sp. FL1857]|nr:hypothetical protein F5Y13DRAFT_191853 [Hypoxylon sp. FL1857]
MRLNQVFNRDLGTCDPGYTFYRCDNGFVGCCSVEACDPDGCPDEENQQITETDSTSMISSTLTPSTFTSFIEVFTTFPDGFTSVTDPFTTDLGYDSGGSSTSSTTTDPSTYSLPQTSQTSSPLSPPSLTPSSTPFPQSTAQSNTNIPQSHNEEYHRLSAAAIAGISVGSTVVGIFLFTIVFLRVRRRYIAKRMASVPSRSPFADEPRGAEKFMVDHPSWRNQPQPESMLEPRGISELP